MISLAGRDILHSWGKYLFTGIGLGLLIGVTLSMAGIYRGMIDDARAHYEAVADDKTGFRLGDRVRIRRHEYLVVGLTRRMVSSSGDPMLFIPLKDAQEVQFLKDNDAIVNDRARSAANPAFNRPGVPGLLEAITASQVTNRNVNAVLVTLREGHVPEAVAADIRRWQHLQAYSRAQMEEILVAKLISTAAKQIGMFLVILAVVSAAIVSFIIYTMTLGKIREIAVLKLIGARDSTIAGMILKEALGLGLVGFIVGKSAATLWAPYFPKFVLLQSADTLRGLAAVMLICAIASVVSIRAALRVDPATAIGG